MPRAVGDAWPRGGCSAVPSAYLSSGASPVDITGAMTREQNLLPLDKCVGVCRKAAAGCKESFESEQYRGFTGVCAFLISTALALPSSGLILWLWVSLLSSAAVVVEVL